MQAETSTPRDEAAFHAERRTGIGGSDTPIILGVSPYSTPLQLWATKTGRAAPMADTALLRRGRKLEAIVAEEYAEETGRLVRTPSVSFFRSEDHPWLCGHVDRLAMRNRDEGVVECKSANVYRAREWEEEAPIHAQIQLQHYLLVTELGWGSVAALIGGLEFRYQDFDAHEGIQQQIVERTREFWALVQTDTPPEPTIGDAKTLSTLWRAIDGEEIELPPEAAAWDRTRLECSADIKRLEDLKEEAESRLKFAMGSATAGTIPGVARYTFKEQTRKEHMVKESTFRVLRRSK